MISRTNAPLVRILSLLPASFPLVRIMAVRVGNNTTDFVRISLR